MEHATPDGKKYWFSRELNRSVWEKPDPLKTAAERRASCNWKEAVAPNSNNKVYYYNSVTGATSWVMPPEYKEFLGSQAAAANPAPAAPFIAAAAAAAAAAPAAALAVHPSRGVNVSVNVVAAPAAASLSAQLAAQREAEKAAALGHGPFLAMLEEAKIGLSMRWEGALRLIVNDPRYESLGSIKEKKQVFSDYQAGRRRAAQEQFRSLLADRADLITESTTLEDIRSAISSDPRYAALDDDRDRDDEVDAAAMAVFRRGRERRRERRKAAAAALRSLLAQRTWATAEEALSGLPAELDRDLEYADKVETLYQVLKARDEADRAAEREQRAAERRAARLARADFKRLLAESREIHARSRWLDFARARRGDPRLLAMLAVTSGSTAAELFYDKVDDFEAAFCERKEAVMKRLPQHGGLPTDSYEAFLAELDNAVKATHDDVTLRSVFEDLQSKRSDSDRRTRERRDKAIDRFYGLLRKHRQIVPTSHWEEVVDLLEGKPEYEAVEADEDRRAAFEDYIQSLKEAASREMERC